MFVSDAVHTDEFLVVCDLVDWTISIVIIRIRVIATNFVSSLIEKCHFIDVMITTSRLDPLD